MAWEWGPGVQVALYDNCTSNKDINNVLHHTFHTIPALEMLSHPLQYFSRILTKVVLTLTVLREQIFYFLENYQKCWWLRLLGTVISVMLLISFIETKLELILFCQVLSSVPQCLAGAWTWGDSSCYWSGVEGEESLLFEYLHYTPVRETGEMCLGTK